MVSLMNIPEADKHPQLNEFITQIKSLPDLANLFERLETLANHLVSVPKLETL